MKSNRNSAALKQTFLNMWQPIFEYVASGRYIYTTIRRYYQRMLDFNFFSYRNENYGHRL